jgi:hypothetical protein
VVKVASAVERSRTRNDSVAVAIKRVTVPEARWWPPARLGEPAEAELT